MHPILARRRLLAAYLAAWLPVAALLTGALMVVGGSRWLDSAALVVPLTALFAFLCLAVWYPCRALPLTGASAGRVLATHVVGAVVSAALWVAMAWLLASELPRLLGSHPLGLAVESAGLLFASGVLLYLLSVAVHYLFVAAEASRAAERRVLEAEVAAREAELLALKTQLNPHFLFNSLNSIAGLATTEPAVAREMCIQLGEFLRGTLRAGGRVTHALADELEHIRRYLAVEQARFGDRLAVVEKIEPESLQCQVPTLLLQPLVENALKHGIAGLVDGGTVTIRARRRGAELVLRVVNPFEAGTPRRAGAFMGLDNVRQRLAGEHGEAAWLRTAARGGLFTVEVGLPVVVGEGDQG